MQTDAVSTSAASWPATDRPTVTGRAVPVANVSGLVTTLVAPVESVSVAVTVVALVAAAAQVTSDWTSVGSEKTQSALSFDFQATEVRVRPSGSTGVTDTWVARPGHRRVVHADRRAEDGRRAGATAAAAVAPADQEPGVGRVPVRVQPGARVGEGGEVVVGVAVEEVLVGDRADLLHREPAAVGVAHGVVLVPAVAGPGAVRRGRRDGARGCASARAPRRSARCCRCRSPSTGESIRRVLRVVAVVRVRSARRRREVYRSATPQMPLPKVSVHIRYLRAALCSPSALHGGDGRAEAGHRAGRDRHVEHRRDASAAPGSVT